MKLVDTNVLIYAVNSDAPHHERMRRWLESALSATEPVGMSWGVLLAFLRITTRRGILERPLPAEDAVSYVDSWLQQPAVELVVPGPNHWAILRALMTTSGTAGNLTSDAHLAALALEGGWTLVSTDHDFLRFSGLAVFNPAMD
ncbi:MAG TPA: type II toxin-antitoxin system VapC family toxin [Thermoanaerobaculia bacterium]|nr:type II toxin-antitoxin system VapC family toxin [Thermoanaerobaculia bacterium]